MANGTISVSQVDVLTTSGTGTISIVPPATNTNRTLTLPDSSGTLALAGSSLTGVTDSASPFETSLGTGAGGSSTGVNNTFIGFDAGNDNTTGTDNTAVGYAALDANTTGTQNTAVGSGALGANITNTGNTAVGYQALLANTANNNTGVGRNALGSNTTGTNNTGVGFYALVSNTTGGGNTAIGNATLESSSTGENNTAVGYTAADAVTSAQKVVAIGFNAGGAITTGNSNVCVGADSGAAITTGTLNIALGRENLQSLTTGDYNTHIGYATSAGAAARASAMVICSGPNGATDKGDSTGFINPNGGGMYNGGNTTTWTTTSDQRLKKNIVDNTEGLDKINGIRVRNFEYRLPEEVDAELSPTDAVIKSGVQIGVIAQELQQVCPDCVEQQSTGVLSVQTDEIFWHMVNAIKDLKAINDAQATRIDTLETKVAALEAK